MGQARASMDEKFCFINCKTQEVFELYDGITFGRGNNANVKILDRRVSRIHLTLFLGRDGNIWFEDSSSNGTFLDGERVSGKMKLTKNLRIRLGDTEFDFIMPKEDKSETKNNNTSRAEISKTTKPRLTLVKQFDENYELYPPASIFKRFIANTIDSILLGIANKIPSILFMNLTLPLFLQIIFIFFSCLLITYFYYKKTLARNGQTIGKKAMNIMVIHTNGEQKISMSTVFKREVVYKTLFFIFSLFPIILSKRKIAIHDYLSKTRVINLSKR